jgi:hypothetical protein
MTEDERRKAIEELDARMKYIVPELEKRLQGHTRKRLLTELNEIDRKLSVLEANDPLFG